MTVRRAVLPWRRRIRPSRFDFTPGGGFGSLLDNPLGLLLAIVLIPLWLPAAVVAVPALVELLAELLLLPLALLVRRLRHRWPVQLLDGGRVLRTEIRPTFAEAGLAADQLRAEHRVLV